MIGETVIVRRATQTGTDPFGNPTGGTVDTPIDDVLVSPGTLADLADVIGIDRSGVQVHYTLHFPKGSDVVAHDQVIVRGNVLDVIGFPDHYIPANTPTRWNLPVQAGTVNG